MEILATFVNAIPEIVIALRKTLLVPRNSYLLVQRTISLRWFFCYFKNSTYFQSLFQNRRCLIRFSFKPLPVLQFLSINAFYRITINLVNHRKATDRSILLLKIPGNHPHYPFIVITVFFSLKIPEWDLPSSPSPGKDAYACSSIRVIDWTGVLKRFSEWS